VITGDYMTGNLVFKRFRSRRNPALVIGRCSTMDGVLFNFGPDAFMEIGDNCHFHDAYLICDQEIRIGDRVTIGWHATIVDADFHPVEPADRMRDAIALSPLSDGAERPDFCARPVVIEDDVWIGPNATILKGVRIGAGAIIEPGAVVPHDVAKGLRVIGNPARPVTDLPQ
jgi:acetyltransferase-like isoleucine patch superfamily enzyme